MAKIKQVPGQLTEWDSQQRMGEPSPKLEEDGSVSQKRSGGCGDKQCKVRHKCSMLLEKMSTAWDGSFREIQGFLYDQE